MEPIKSYAKALELMYQQLPMFHRIGTAAYKKDLTNTLALCSANDQPHLKFPTVHIAGTNGKGSVSHLIAALLQSHGYKTGLYISPHYRDFRERIKINGEYIPQRRVIDFLQRNREVMAEIQPSFFELSVVMAFDHFAKENIDIAVIETGLGGRIDSTNVILPLLSIITNISKDHTDILGESLQLIAAEKAGIIKNKTPVLIGRKQEETQRVFEEVAASREAQLYYAEEMLEHNFLRSATSEFRSLIHMKKPNLDIELVPDLQGIYQQENIRTAIAAYALLHQNQNYKFSPAKVRFALENCVSLTKIMGRFHWLSKHHPRVLCESAHNEDGIRLTFEQIAKISFRKLHIVCGFVKDKSLDHLWNYFPKDAQYYFCKANIPRGLDAAELQQQASGHGLEGRSYSSVRKALQYAKLSSKKDDLILVTGSIFVVAEVI